MPFPVIPHFRVRTEYAVVFRGTRDLSLYLRPCQGTGGVETLGPILPRALFVGLLSSGPTASPPGRRVPTVRGTTVTTRTKDERKRVGGSRPVGTHGTRTEMDVTRGNDAIDRICIDLPWDLP